MTWQQIFVLAWMLLSVVIGVSSWVRDKRYSPAWATIGICLTIAFSIVYGLVLHSGGFW